AAMYGSCTSRRCAPDGPSPFESRNATQSTLCAESRQASCESVDSSAYRRGKAMKPDMDQICALTSFSVGTLDGRDAMMVIEMASTAEEYEQGVRRQMPVAMTAEHARELGEALLLAAKAALMGDTPSYALN